MYTEVKLTYNICYICKEKFENKYVKDKNIVKLEIIFIIQKKYTC